MEANSYKLAYVGYKERKEFSHMQELRLTSEKLTLRKSSGIFSTEG